MDSYGNIDLYFPELDISDDDLPEMDKDFMELIYNNDIDQLYRLLKGEKKKYLYDDRYVEYAVKIGAVDVLVLFKNLGDISTVISNQKIIGMALEQYTKEKTYKTVLFLLENGTKPKYSHIGDIIKKGYLDIAILLINFGVRLDKNRKRKLLDKAIIKFDYLAIKEIYEIYETQGYQITPSNHALEILIDNDNVEIVELLLKKNQTILLNFLERSIDKKSFGIGKSLIDHGAIVNSVIFEKCVISGDRRLIDSLKNINIETKNILLDNFVVWNKYEMVKIIIDLGANPNASRYNYVRFAVEKGYLDILELLLSYGANPNGTNPNHIPLFRAIQTNNITAIDILLEANADVNVTLHGNNALMLALKEKLDYSNIYKFYLRTSNFEQRNLEGETALKIASMSSTIPIIELLLASSGEIIYDELVKRMLPNYIEEYMTEGPHRIIGLINRLKKTKNSNMIIIRNIIKYGNLNILADIIDYDSSLLNNKNIFDIKNIGYDILIKYLGMILPFLDRQNLDIFQTFLIKIELEYKLEIPDEIIDSYIKHYKFLENALDDTLINILKNKDVLNFSENNFRIIRKLIQEGANVNYIPINENIPLVLSYSNKMITTILLDYGADPNLLDRNGLPPLFYIGVCDRNYDHYKITKILLEAGADPYFTDVYGKNPLVNYLFYTNYVSPKVVDLLINSTPDLDYNETLKLYVRKSIHKNFTIPKNDATIKYFTHKTDSIPDITLPQYPHGRYIVDHSQNGTPSSSQPLHYPQNVYYRGGNTRGAVRGRGGTRGRGRNRSLDGHGDGRHDSY